MPVCQRAEPARLVAALHSRKELTMNIITTNANPTMSSREIAELTGSTHDNVLKTVRRLIAEGVVSENETPYKHPQNGQTYTEFLLSFRNTMVVVSGYSAELRAKIIDRWQELEAATAKSAVTIPQSLPEALRLAADLAEQKAAAEAERDEAIRTKAMIGSKREATAMATAAAAKREADRLALELDQSMQYASVKRMEQIYPGRKFNWRDLKKASMSLGLKAKDIFDQNYTSVKAYHAAVWKAVYSLDVAVERSHA